MSRVLVAYASKHGATAEIAEAVAHELRHAGHTVDCVSAAEVEELAGYGAAVVGSAVYMARWRPEARRLIKRRARELSERPLWLFSSGPCGQAEPSYAAPPGIERRAKRLGARGHVVFGGRLPEEPSNLIERSMLGKTPPEYRDLRDWRAIRAWAAGIAGELAQAPERAVVGRR
jgi:menaquinone-dependent protoporphyrinogen oxidase